MGIDGLRECGDCGHVQNHHSTAHGCHIAGCLCRRFTFRTYSESYVQDLIHDANSRIKSWKDRAEKAEGELATVRKQNENLKQQIRSGKVGWGAG